MGILYLRYLYYVWSSMLWPKGFMINRLVTNVHCKHRAITLNTLIQRKYGFTILISDVTDYRTRKIIRREITW